MTCTYITVLDRECGRPCPGELHCDFHAVLDLFDRLPLDVITVLDGTNPHLVRARTRLIRELEKTP